MGEHHRRRAEWPGNPGSDGASPYHLERRCMPRSDNIKDRLTLRAPDIPGFGAIKHPKYALS
jgi:hypothetical protein